MSFERLYWRLPVALQNAACSAQGWRIARRRYGAEFHRILALYEARGKMSDEAIRELRDARLRSFVQHAAETVPHYRTLFRENRIDSREIRTLADLARLPVLTRAAAQQAGIALRSSSVSDHGLIRAHTSGTTGTGFIFRTTRQAEHEQWAVWWRYRRWHGLPLHTWCGYFGGRSIVPVHAQSPPFWRINRVGRQILFSGYHMSPQNLPQYVSELRRRRPPWLHGYPSLLALLAGHMLDRGSSLDYDVRWITCGAENLLPSQAALIERAFGVSPRQHYGMAEGVANFSECERGRLHVDEDFAAAEFVAQDDGAARIVGTNLSNPATPLLRYDTGDVAVLEDRPCDCGRPGRIVRSVDGRLEDYVVLGSGARVGRLDHVFKDLSNIREAQIVQHEPGRVTFRIVRGSGYGPADERRLLAEARLRLGAECEVAIRYVDAIERTRSGKLRFVISDIAPVLASAGDAVRTAHT